MDDQASQFFPCEISWVGAIAHAALASETEPVGSPEAIAWNLLRGAWGRIEALVADRDDDLARTLQLLALRKKGRRDAERTFARTLLPGLVPRGRWDLAMAFHVEAAASAKNQGDYREALDRLAGLGDATRAFLPMPPPIPRFWRWRASVVRGITCQALGHFDAVRDEIALQDALARVFDLADLRFSVERRRFAALLETESWDEAARLLSSVGDTAGVASRSPLTAILWQLDALRLHLARHEAGPAAARLEVVTAIIEANALPRTYVNVVEERVELALLPAFATSGADDGTQTSDAMATSRADAAARALELVERALGQGERDVSLASYCAIRVLQAEAEVARGRPEEAWRSLEIASALASSQGFGRLRVRIGLATWMLQSALAREEAAKETARRLAVDPAQRAYRIHGACVRLLAACEGLSPTPLCDLVASHLPVLRSALRPWACRYRLDALASARFRFEDAFASARRKETPRLEDVFEPSTGTLLFCQASREVFRSEGDGWAPVRLGSVAGPASARSTLDRAFLAFLSARRGEVPQERLFALLEPGTPFTALRHVERVRNLVSRLRRRLADAGLPARIEAGGRACVYRLTPGWATTRRLRYLAPTAGSQAGTTPSVPRRGRPRQEIPRRAREVAAAAEQLGDFRFGDMAARFPMARQSLHAHLALLVERGWLAHEKRGRGSRYLWVRPRGA